MKEVDWKKLSGFKKFIVVLGWLAAGNLLFWALILLKRFQFPQGNYKKLFNPDTMKVVYIFGLIHFICLVGFILFILILVAGYKYILSIQ